MKWNSGTEIVEQILLFVVLLLFYCLQICGSWAWLFRSQLSLIDVSVRFLGIPAEVNEMNAALGDGSVQ